MRVLGICGGNGVILYPFKKYLIGNIENRSIFRTKDNIQWNLNFNVPILNHNHIISSALKFKRGTDIIIGAPDCGHSSVLSYSRAKKLGNPKENKSLHLFIESIKFYLPKIFLFENLPNLFKTFGEENFDKAFPNYRLIKHLGSVSQFGNSQKSRKRLVVIGIRNDLSSKIDKYFKLSAKEVKLKTSGILNKGLEYPNAELCHIREDDHEVIAIYGGKKLSVGKIKRIWNKRLKHSRRWSIPNSKMRTAPGVYRNFNRDFPMTVRKQNRQFNENGEMMSPRELARIQGIPDNFKIWYNPDNKKHCINKGRVSVTKGPPMEIGYWFKKCLIKSQKLWN